MSEPSKNSELILNGSVSKAVLFLAVPAMGNFFLETFFHLVDIYWIAKLGEKAIASIAAWAFISWCLLSIAQIAEVGINSLVAKSWGTKDFEKGRKIASSGFHFSLWVSVTSAIIFYLLSVPLMDFMNLEPEVVALALDYLNVMLFGVPLLGMLFSIDATFRGSGDTVTPIKILSVVILLNCILDPILIFGYFGFPKLELFGAALATVFSNFVGVIWGFYLLTKRGFYWKLNVLPKKETIFRIAKIGSPIALNGLLFSYVYIHLTRIITDFGTTQVAALTLGHRIEGFLWPICLGFLVTATTMVGQNLGAGKFERVRQSVNYTAFFSAAICLVISLLFIFKGAWIASFFTDDVVLAEASGKYLKIIGYFEMFLGLELTFEGAFAGLGKTVPTIAISTPINLGRIPLAIYFASLYGIEGIWWTIGITTMLKGAILGIWLIPNYLGDKELLKLKH